MNSIHNCFIVNPAAGGGKNKGELVEKIRLACENQGVEYEIHITKEAGDAEKFVRAECLAHPDGAFGFANAEIAAVPAGTGNDFIKSFSSPEAFLDIEAQLCGSALSLDLIKFNEKYCINVLNIGFDCLVVEKMKHIRSAIKVPNSIAYPLGVISAFFDKFGNTYTITFDDEPPVTKNYLLCAFGNARIYGGGFCAAPLANLNDGLIDVCTVEKISRGKFISLLGDYKKGTHVVRDVPLDFVTYKKCKKIHFESEKEVGVCLDGEITRLRDIYIEAVPEAISFAVPRGSECLILA